MFRKHFQKQIPDISVQQKSGTKFICSTFRAILFHPLVGPVGCARRLVSCRLLGQVGVLPSLHSDCAAGRANRAARRGGRRGRSGDRVAGHCPVPRRLCRPSRWPCRPPTRDAEAAAPPAAPTVPPTLASNTVAVATVLSSAGYCCADLAARRADRTARRDERKLQEHASQI